MSRASIFGKKPDQTVATEPVDLSDFKPAPPDSDPEAFAQQAKKAAEKLDFKSREPAQADSAQPKDTRYRTGRVNQMNIRMTAETERLIKALAYRADLPIARIVERAIRDLAEKEGLTG